MADTPGRDDELLFHMVLIIDLQHIDGKPEPFVSYRLPKLWTKDPFSAAVASFCFPDMDDFPKEEMQNESFSFVLTESDGDRRFGYCLRRLQQGNGARMPVAYVVLSYLSCTSLYTRILERVAYHYENSSGVILTKFLESVIQNPFPAPGETCHVQITDTTASTRGSGSRVGSRLGTSPEQEKLTWKFTRPDSDSEFENVDIAALVQTLDATNIIRAFISLLVERRVIFCAKKITTLSAVVQAIMALLYPLSWQHIFIPILPASLLSYCCAPMPFVVGVLSSSIDEVLKLPMDAVTIIMLDENKFLHVSSEEMEDDLDLLPARFLATLTKQLKLTAKAAKKCSKKSMVNKRLGEVAQAITARKVQELVLQKILLDFYSEILKPVYLLHHIAKPGDHPSLSDAVTLAPPDLRPLMKFLVTSQLMEMFVQEHIIDKEPGHNDAFQKKMLAWLRKEHPTPEQEEEDKKGPSFRASSNAQVKELMDKARSQAAPKRSSVIYSSSTRRRTMANDPHLLPPPSLPSREPRSRSATHRVMDMANKPLPSAPTDRPGHKRQLSHSQVRTLPNKPSSHSRQLSASAFPTLQSSARVAHPPKPEGRAPQLLHSEEGNQSSIGALPRQASMPTPQAAASDGHISMGALPTPGQQRGQGRGPPPRPPPKKAPSAPVVTAVEPELKAPEERAPPVPPPKVRPAGAVPPQRPAPPTKPPVPQQPPGPSGPQQPPEPQQPPSAAFSPRPGHRPQPMPKPQAASGPRSPRQHPPQPQPPRGQAPPEQVAQSLQDAAPQSVSAPPTRPKPPAARPQPPPTQAAVGALSPRQAPPARPTPPKVAPGPKPPQRPQPPSVLPPGATAVFPVGVMPVRQPPVEEAARPQPTEIAESDIMEPPAKELPPCPPQDYEEESEEELPDVPPPPSAAELASIYSESLVVNLERDRVVGILDSATLDESMERLIETCGSGIVLLEEEYDDPVLYWEAVEASMWNGEEEASWAGEQAQALATEMGCLDAGLLYLLDFVEKKIPEGEGSFAAFSDSAAAALAKCKERVFSGSSGKAEVSFIRTLFRERHQNSGKAGAPVTDEQLQARLDAISDRARAAKKAQLKVVQEQRNQFDKLEACSSLEAQVEALGALRSSTRRSQRSLKKILASLTSSWAEVETEIRQVVMEEQTLYFESIATLMLTKFMLYCKAISCGALARLQSQLEVGSVELEPYQHLLDKLLAPSYCTSVHVFMTSLGCDEATWVRQDDLRRHAALMGRCYTHNSIDELQVMSGLLSHAATLRFASQIRLLGVPCVSELARVIAELVTFFVMQDPMKSPLSSGGDMAAGHQQAVDLLLKTLHTTPPSLEFDTVFNLLNTQAKITLGHPENPMLSCTVPAVSIVVSAVIKIGDGFSECELFVPHDTSYLAQCLAINTSFLTVNGFPGEAVLIKDCEKGWWSKEPLTSMAELLQNFRHLQVTEDDGDDSCGSDDEA